MNTISSGPQTTETSKTILGIVVAVLLVIPSLIPASIIVLIYKFFFGFFVIDHWIPYFEEISMLWFPELLRGGIVGAITILLTSAIAKKADINIVRYSTFAFWSGLYLFVTVIGISVKGFTLDIVGILAFFIGFGVGMWSDEFV